MLQRSSFNFLMDLKFNTNFPKKCRSSAFNLTISGFSHFPPKIILLLLWKKQFALWSLWLTVYKHTVRNERVYTTNLTSVRFPSSYSVPVLATSHQDVYQLLTCLFPALFSHCSAQRVVVGEPGKIWLSLACQSYQQKYLESDWSSVLFVP